MILAAHTKDALLVATDSFSGMSPSGPVLGSKTLHWPAHNVLLTGIGDFDEAPIGVARHYTHLARFFAANAKHAVRAAELIDILNREPHIHAQGGKSASCFFMGYDGGIPMVSVFHSAGNVGSWAVQPDATLPLAGGYLEPIGLLPTSGIGTSPIVAMDESSIRAWEAATFAQAQRWFDARPELQPTIMPPYHEYRLSLA